MYTTEIICDFWDYQRETRGLKGNYQTQVQQIVFHETKKRSATKINI